MTSREQPRQDRSPQTPLGQRLAEIRGRIKASGTPLLSWEDVDRELIDRRDSEGPIEEMVERIVERFDPLRVVLFGSHARGEATRDSDVDLLVVFPHVERENKRNLTVEIRRALADAPIPKDVVVTDLDEISRRGKLVGTALRAALQEGKVLYDRP
jgi:predicted nucleotidyltransferase